MECKKHFDLKYISQYKCKYYDNNIHNRIYALYHVKELFYRPYKCKTLCKMMNYLLYDEEDEDMLIKYIYNFSEYWATKNVKNLIIDTDGVITQIPIKHCYIIDKAETFYVSN
jgi:hypothetical protein